LRTPNLHFFDFGRSKKVTLVVDILEETIEDSQFHYSSWVLTEGDLDAFPIEKY